MIGTLRDTESQRFLPAGAGPGGGEGGALLPWLIAAMAFLTALALAGGIALGSATRGLTADLGRTATVQIVQPDHERRDAQAAAVRAMLAGDPAVERVIPVERAEIERLLRPWLGEAGLDADLPLPAMIDVALRADADPAALAARVRAAAPDARLDAHAQWLGPLAGLLGVLQWTAAGIVLLVVAATAAVVTLGVRSGLGVHRPTIEVLHLMGAEDALIARIFRRRFLVHGLAGGAIGTLCALAIIIVVGGLASRLDGGLVAAAALPPLGWAALLLVPPAIGLLATVAAETAVLRALAARL